MYGIFRAPLLTPTENRAENAAKRQPVLTYTPCHFYPWCLFRLCVVLVYSGWRRMNPAIPGTVKATIPCSGA